jgi:hypothetical protein
MLPLFFELAMLSPPRRAARPIGYEAAQGPAPDLNAAEARVPIIPKEPAKIADVSLVEGTIAGRNYSFFFTSPRNGIEEADGSIPFSSAGRERAKRIRFATASARYKRHVTIDGSAGHLRRRARLVRAPSANYF